jgi:hypothetical protein
MYPYQRIKILKTMLQYAVHTFHIDGILETIKQRTIFSQTTWRVL